GLGSARRAGLALRRVGLARGARGLGGRGRRAWLAPASSDPVGRRPPRRRLSRLREEPQRRRVRLRPRLGGRGGAGEDRVLSEAPRRGAVHAGHGGTLPRMRRGAGRGGGRAGRGARGDVLPGTVVVGARELLRRGGGGGARPARLAPP